MNIAARWGLAAFALGLVAVLPLRLALGNSGLSAQRISGSIWHGRIAAAQLHGLALGDIDVRMASLLPLRMAFDGLVSGNVALDRSVIGLTGRVNTGSIVGFPVSFVDFDAVSMGFDGGRCRASGGRVTVQLGGGEVLRGSPACENDAWRLVLAPSSGGTRVVLRLSGDGKYRADLRLSDVAEGDRQGLLAAGFAPTPAGLARVVEGQW